MSFAVFVRTVVGISFCRFAVAPFAQLLPWILRRIGPRVGLIDEKLVIMEANLHLSELGTYVRVPGLDSWCLEDVFLCPVLLVAQLHPPGVAGPLLCLAVSFPG